MTRRIRRASRTGLALLALHVPAHAASWTVYSDGTTHTVNSPTGSLLITNGSALNIADGSFIEGMDSRSVWASGPSNRVIMSGGVVTGISPIGIEIGAGATLTMTGGSVLNGIVIDGGSGAVLISGGSASLADMGPSTRITGGAFGTLYLKPSRGFAEIDGGSFGPLITLSCEDGGSIMFAGNLSYADGEINGFLRNGDHIDCRIECGDAFAATTDAGIVFSMAGTPGTIVAEPASWIPFGIGVVAAGIGGIRTNRRIRTCILGEN